VNVCVCACAELVVVAVHDRFRVASFDETDNNMNAVPCTHTQIENKRKLKKAKKREEAVPLLIL